MIKKTINQPIVGVHGRRDVGEKAGWAVSVLGTWYHHLGQKFQCGMIKKGNKIHCGLRRLLIDNRTHNNQPTTGGCGGEEDGEEVQCKGADLMCRTGMKIVWSAEKMKTNPS